jgi:hypothetical protein
MEEWEKPTNWFGEIMEGINYCSETEQLNKIKEICHRFKSNATLMRALKEIHLVGKGKHLREGFPLFPSPPYSLLQKPNVCMEEKDLLNYPTILYEQLIALQRSVVQQRLQKIETDLLHLSNRRFRSSSTVTDTEVPPDLG